jgi:ferrous iron transport protein A
MDPLNSNRLNPETVPLATLRKGSRAVVVEVLEGDAGIVGDEAGATIGRRLIEIGFVPGEQVQIIEEVWPGGDPMAVRVGSTVFALRRREARAVLVRVSTP